jgi:hypothetical protein
MRGKDFMKHKSQADDMVLQKRMAIFGLRHPVQTSSPRQEKESDISSGDLG